MRRFTDLRDSIRCRSTSETLLAHLLMKQGTAPAEAGAVPSDRGITVRVRSDLQGNQHFVEHLLRVAEEHAVVILVEQRIVHPRITCLLYTSRCV